MVGLKWTLRFLKLVSSINFIMAVLFLIVGAFHYELGFFYAVGAILCLAMSLGYNWTYRNLIAKSKWAWNVSIFLNGLGLFGIFLPFAIMSLRELLNEGARTTYMTPVIKEQKPFTVMQSINNMYDVASTNEVKRLSTLWKLGYGLTLAVAILLMIKSPSLDPQPQAHLPTKKTSVKNCKYELDNLSVSQLFEIGARTNTSGDMICSQAIFKKILELDPHNTTALSNLAMALTNLGQHEDALPLYELYFKFGGQAIDVEFEYGRSLESVQQNEKAIEIYLQILNQNSELIDVAQRAVHLLLLENQTEAATLIVQKFIEKNPNLKTYFPKIPTEETSTHQNQNTTLENTDREI